MNWKRYQRRVTSGEMRPYIPGEDLAHIGVHPDQPPEEGGYIGRNPHDHTDQYYVSPQRFAEIFHPRGEDIA